MTDEEARRCDISWACEELKQLWATDINPRDSRYTRFLGNKISSLVQVECILVTGICGVLPWILLY